MNTTTIGDEIAIATMDTTTNIKHERSLQQGYHRADDPVVNDNDDLKEGAECALIIKETLRQRASDPVGEVTVA